MVCMLNSIFIKSCTTFDTYKVQCNLFTYWWCKMKVLGTSAKYHHQTTKNNRIGLRLCKNNMLTLQCNSQGKVGFCNFWWSIIVHLSSNFPVEHVDSRRIKTQLQAILPLVFHKDIPLIYPLFSWTKTLSWSCCLQKWVPVKTTIQFAYALISRPSGPNRRNFC